MVFHKKPNSLLDLLRQVIRGLITNQTPQLIDNSPLDNVCKELGLGKQGESDSPVCQSWFSEGRPDLDTQVGESANLVVSPSRSRSKSVQRRNFQRATYIGILVEISRHISFWNPGHIWRPMGTLSFTSRHQNVERWQHKLFFISVQTLGPSLSYPR